MNVFSFAGQIEYFTMYKLLFTNIRLSNPYNYCIHTKLDLWKLLSWQD